MARRTETQALVLPSFDDAASRTLAQTYAEQHEQVAAVVLAAVVDSPETQARAVEWAHKIKERRELVGKELEFATTLRRLANEFSKRWNPALQPLDRALEHLRSQLALYIERSRAAAAAALPQSQTQAEVAQAVAVIAPKAADTIERQEWSAEVVMTPEATRAALLALGDPRVAAILAMSLPPEYTPVDQSRLDREAKQLHEAFAVPGAKAVCGVGISFRKAAA